MLPLSQSHLSHLDACARRYEYVFFDSLAGPASYEQHLKTQWGSQFHLLMQQQALNLPVETLARVDEEMSASLSALQAAAPDVFEYLSKTVPSDQASHQGSALAKGLINSQPFSQSEHRRTLTFNGYLLTAIYDLVVLSQATPQPQGLIFDWKTHQQPPNRDQLQRNWQTRLYLYLLSETSELAPEDISMTYWFVRMTSEATQTVNKPSFYKFSYSLAEHDQTRRDLQTLTDRLTEMRETAHFPKVAIEKGLCDRCPFNVRCDRLSADSAFSSTSTSSTSTTDPQQLLKTARQLAIENIPEIPL